METELGRANVKIRATMEKLDSDLGEAREKVESAITRITTGAGKAMQGLGTVALAGVGAAAGAVLGLGAALAKVTVDAAPVEGLSQSFEGLAESAGRGADEMLAALKRGSAGMVSNRDLMMSFNQAAQLVSTDFATQLPDAMQYLGKVSAATGQDMGFMLNSLVKGVGRMSPMILDNLGIQVSLEEATARAAEMYGVEASALDKTQLQAGMMNVVLEKLAANTAAMPEVTETAAARMAQFKATIQDTKDQVGMAFLPVLSSLLGTAGAIGERVLPILVGALETIAPVVERVALAVGGFVTSVLSGQDPLTALRDLVTGLFPPEVAERIMGIVDGIVLFGEKVAEFLEPILAWIGENVQLQDVLIALGIAIASVVVPALISIVASIVASAAPIIAAAVALIAIVALVRKAWESDFLGIRTFVLNTLTQIRTWWEQHGAQVIATVQAMWTWIVTTVTTVFTAVKEFIAAALEAIREWWRAHGEDVITIVRANFNVLRTVIETVINVISAIINTVLGTIRRFWDEHGQAIIRLAQNAWDNIKTIVDTVIHTVQEIIGAVAAAIRGDWSDFGEYLKSIWQGVWDGIKRILGNAWDSIRTVFNEIIEKIKGPLTKAFEWLQGVADKLSRAFDGVKYAVGLVMNMIENLLDKIREYKDKIGDLFGSPQMVLEIGFEGVSQAVRQLARVELPALNRELAPVMADLSGGAIDQSRETVINVEPHYYKGDEASLGEELRVLRLAYGL